jgi:hypothetical protein
MGSIRAERLHRRSLITCGLITPDGLAQLVTEGFRPDFELPQDKDWGMPRIGRNLSTPDFC